MLVFKTGGRQVVPAQPEVRARIQSVGRAVVDAGKSEITEGIKGGEPRIDLLTVVVSPARAYVLVSDRIRNRIVDFMRQSYGAHQQAIAPSLIGIIEIGIERKARYGFGIKPTRESGRQGEGAVVYPRVGNRAKEIRANSDRGGRVKIDSTCPRRVAVLVAMIDAVPHVQPCDAETVARALAQAA